MVTFRDLVRAFRQLDINSSQPVIVHASLSSLGEVIGGARTLLGALLSVFPSVVMPTFTYKTMITPEVGPPDNAINYGSAKDANRMAEFFQPQMPADRLMGILAETLRQNNQAVRSSHPILSFAGIGAEDIVQSQSIENPLAPIQALVETNGWAILIGVDHTVNTSIHWGERMSGRMAFTRWALTRRGIVECPGFPGCSNGFQAIAPHVEKATHRVQLVTAEIKAVFLPALIETVQGLIAEDPTALLCDRQDCDRCGEVRATVGER
ncbi:MAG: AAC(3) family N-acetyltransferase [Anaerolineales bacterium]|nr:AAC(3) family N-acetyltransferase [Anaerolineales bacterium]